MVASWAPLQHLCGIKEKFEPCGIIDSTCGIVDIYVIYRGLKGFYRRKFWHGGQANAAEKAAGKFLLGQELDRLDDPYPGSGLSLHNVQFLGELTEEQEMPRNVWVQVVFNSITVKFLVCGYV